ncbi:cadherin repeat domain-containing protein, partial [Corallococcus exiguus]|uniref:cadherin repeat domain-containing protein n=1 Tax=Corallococcus exiguus TaxID=83462 RepID=UPI0014754822
SHAFTVVATDGDGEKSTKTFSLTVGDVNEAPSLPVLSRTSISENAEVGAQVGTLSSSDPEGGKISFLLKSNPGGIFKLVGNKLVLAKTVDYDKAQSHTVTIEAKDASGLVTTQKIKIDVTDVAKTTLGTIAADVLKGGAGVDVLRG